MKSSLDQLIEAFKNHEEPPHLQETISQETLRNPYRPLVEPVTPEHNPMNLQEFAEEIQTLTDALFLWGWKNNCLTQQDTDPGHAIARIRNTYPQEILDHALTYQGLVENLAKFQLCIRIAGTPPQST